jgi:hypothetical protein
MPAPPGPTPPYRDTKLPGAEQTRLASMTAADGVTRVEGLLGDRGDEAIARLVGLLEKVVENQLAAERRLKRLEQALGIVLQEAELPLPPGLELIPPAPPPTTPSQALRKP